MSLETLRTPRDCKRIMGVVIREHIGSILTNSHVSDRKGLGCHSLRQLVSTDVQHLLLGDYIPKRPTNDYDVLGHPPLHPSATKADTFGTLKQYKLRISWDMRCRGAGLQRKCKRLIAGLPGIPVWSF